MTPDFIASIKEHGVMEPVIAHRKDDGVVHVLMGQRRTGAAGEAGRTKTTVEGALKAKSSNAGAAALGNRRRPNGSAGGILRCGVPS